jgi:nitrate/TMAO reductase-like tetraheme cytochrome c subunit
VLGGIWIVPLAMGVDPKPLFTKNGEAPIPIQKTPPGIAGQTARACNSCHSEIYEEWKRSMHGVAWADPQFQEVWQSKGSPAKCLNCHSPLAAQQPNLGDRENPDFRPTLQAEGVTCAACHIRNSSIVGRGSSLGSVPHPVQTRQVMARSEMCRGCHQLDLAGRKEGFYDTYREWTATTYAKRDVSCQDCHMPVRTGNVAVGVHRPYRTHEFRGGHSDVLLQRALTVTVQLDHPTYQAGQIVNAKVDVANTGAGHHVPTGDPRHQVRLRIGIADERGVFLSQKDEVFARNLQLIPPFKEGKDTRLVAGEHRQIKVSTKLPGGAGERYFVVQLSYHLVDPKIAKTLGIPKEVASRVFDSQVIPITQLK